MAGNGILGGSAQGAGEHAAAGAVVIAKAVVPGGPHRGPAVGRPCVGVVPEIVVVVHLAAIPAAVVAMIPAVVGVDRIVAMATIVPSVGGIVSGTGIARRVVVAEVVVAVTRPHEEVIGEDAQGDNDTRRVVIIGPRIVSVVEANGCEEHAAAGHRVIPVAVDIHVAAGGPAVAGRHPVPVVAQYHPVARTPGIAVFIPHPVSRNPVVVLRRGGDVRAHVDAFWRGGGDVFHLFGLGVRPIAGDPLVLGPFKRVPVAGDPLAFRREIPPDAADPEEIVLVLVPSPVAGDPGDVLTLELLLGRQFFDRLGRGGGNDEPGLGLVAHRLGEGLVDRAAGEHVEALVFGGERRFDGRGGDGSEDRPRRGVGGQGAEQG